MRSRRLKILQGRRRRRHQISRQLAWRRRKLADGLCPICGTGQLNLYRSRCDACAIREREAQQRRRGGSPWKPGSRGPKPRTEA